MKKIIRLTEDDLARIVKRIIVENELSLDNEQEEELQEIWPFESKAVKEKKEALKNEAEELFKAMKDDETFDKKTWDKSVEKALDDAKEYKYDGQIKVKYHSRTDAPFIKFIGNPSTLQKMGMGTGSQTSGK